MNLVFYFHKAFESLSSGLTNSVLRCRLLAFVNIRCIYKRPQKTLIIFLFSESKYVSEMSNLCFK